MFRKIYQNDFCQKVHLSTRGILGNMEEIEEEIEELILKRYAKRSSSNSTKGKTWYLLHYISKHASNPGKVRIVFD